MPKDWSSESAQNEAFAAEVQRMRKEGEAKLEAEAKDDAAALKEKFGPPLPQPQEVGKGDEELEGSDASGSTSTGSRWNDNIVRSVQGPPDQNMSDEALLADVAAAREQQKAQAKADADALSEKLGPAPPWVAEIGESDWVERGIQNVPVADLPWPEGVNGPEDFDHHISYDDAVDATEQLESIKPQIAQGLDSGDFAAQDAANGLDYEHGKQRVYDLFYGSQSIRLNKDGDAYSIVHGRHRVYVAKELGLDSIPADVVEKATS